MKHRKSAKLPWHHNFEPLIIVRVEVIVRVRVKSRCWGSEGWVGCRGSCRFGWFVSEGSGLSWWSGSWWSVGSLSCHGFTHLQFLKWQSAVPRGYKSVPCGYKSVPRGYKSVPRGYKLVPCGYKYTRSSIELPGQLKNIDIAKIPYSV